MPRRNFMRLTLALAFTLALASLAGCGSREAAPQRIADMSPASGSSANAGAAADSRAGGGGDAKAAMQDVSLQQADASQAQPVPAERKIIRDATLTLEVEEPVKAAERITSIADSHGG